MKEIICPRCAGRGVIEKYNHVECGRCFQCEGSGKIPVEDHITDIIAELREMRKQSSKVEKEFNNLWDQYKDELKIYKQWYNYILCEGTEETTKDEERLLRVKQYIQYKIDWKAYINNHMELIDNLDKYMQINNEFELNYMNRGE